MKGNLEIQHICSINIFQQKLLSKCTVFFKVNSLESASLTEEYLKIREYVSVGEFGCTEDADCATGLRCGADGKCENTFCSQYMKTKTGSAWEYHNGICYKYYSSSKYRTDARNYCTSKYRGGDLADVPTESVYVGALPSNKFMKCTFSRTFFVGTGPSMVMQSSGPEQL